MKREGAKPKKPFCAAVEKGLADKAEEVSSLSKKGRGWNRQNKSYSTDDT